MLHMTVGEWKLAWPNLVGSSERWPLTSTEMAATVHTSGLGGTLAMSRVKPVSTLLCWPDSFAGNWVTPPAATFTK